MARILIADDDAGVREGLAEAVADLGHEVVAAADGEAALAAAGPGIAAVLLDLRMPGALDGLEVLRRLRARRGAPPVAILTAYASASNTIEAMRLGAFDHLTKPVGRADIAELLGRMLRPDAPPPQDAAAAEDAEALVGVSAAMRAVQKTIGRVADGDATVLVTGETGTGKEVVARALHRFGRRAAGPFVALNCAAIPPDLLEAELFGHARGAFTGALAERRGAFREAHGGTLFLDEVGDMDLAMQAKILRAVQEREVTPLGGRPVRVDVRIVAATHRDLPARVREGAFREDLYYRLAVVPVHLPPLRERPADLVPLAEHFLARLPGRRQLAADAASRLLAHPWPGNARELRNAMERAAALGQGAVIGAADLDFLGAIAPPAGTEDWLAGDLPTAIARLERAMLLRALRETGGNRAEAARRLGIHRQLLYAKLRQFGLDALSAERTEAVRTEDAAPAGAAS
ncbi:sigma-54-dependent transcriptional regulator [Paracraurococcus ruber]|uniref:Sigma-54-dependent Fis family transcriptional regulator n=1 Tax=Paracraurococcus ruber TaxID=77675 RepID=A0ABS1CS07_9PROT|nr:sigma-54-dependent Fis family transcriptional regulator [Paracraurococcus ruber]TDG32585.1 sigma-54-dependent Fis family transcriptional regulator [Paracraurococcus ruber]